VQEISHSFGEQDVAVVLPVAVELSFYLLEAGVQEAGS
jgi:hypothetical protein